MEQAWLEDPADLEQWRQHARRLLAAGCAPSQVLWQGQGATQGAAMDLFASSPASPTQDPEPVRPMPRVPARFLELAGLVIAHADPQRHARLYRILWRLIHGERHLLVLATDEDVAWALDAAKAVRREKHKMKAFVRFREVADPQGSVYVAWFEPEHDVLGQVAPFFVRRFAGMRWSILTPQRSAHWDGERLSMQAGARRSEAPDGDELESLWRVYYANIFNPARLKVDAMVKEMPVRYWKNLPEATLIPGLVREASARLQSMVAAAPTQPRKHIRPPALGWQQAPETGNALDALRDGVRACRSCPLWAPATQAVAGEGPVNARAVLVGEQPGDQEDLVGRPFVGPAGQLLDRALAEAGLDRGQLYLTNAVKHFKYQPRGKRRLHARASAQEQAACLPWLHAELDQISPRWVVCLGSVAAQALLGPGFELLDGRGRWYGPDAGPQILPTVHPAWLLRLPAAERAQAWPAFVADLQQLVRRLAGSQYAD
jgi:probable DNA metabolism protein